VVSKTDIAHRRQIFRAARGKKVVLLHQHFLVDRPSRSKSWPELQLLFVGDGPDKLADERFCELHILSRFGETGCERNL
jgi:hypothetical protein